jgi:acetamidase/formamidase
MVLSAYEPGVAFSWVTGRTTDVCALTWPSTVRPARPPNVLVVDMDDTGFGQLGSICGAHAVVTPTPDVGDDADRGTYPAPVSGAVPL